MNNDAKTKVKPQNERREHNNQAKIKKKKTLNPMKSGACKKRTKGTYIFIQNRCSRLASRNSASSDQHGTVDSNLSCGDVEPAPGS
jgi:hypothetical protein